jgi:5-methylcytosine-specific restriction endonuclease McrA
MSSDPEAGRKLRNAIEDYAQRQDLTGASQASDLEAVLACFVPEPDAADELRSLVVDCVFRYLFASAKQIYEETEGNDNLLDTELENFLKRKTRLTGDNVGHFRRYLKQAILTSKAKRPKSEVRTRLLSKQRNRYCYICGTEIVPPAIERLDHVWPYSAGGGTSKGNLLRAHPECESAKADLAVPGDAAIGRFAFTSLPQKLEDRADPWWPRSIGTDEEFLELSDDIRAAQLRIALLHRQGFKCHRCDTALSEAGEAVLERKNCDEPWWFPNTVVVCSTCTMKA